MDSDQKATRVKRLVVRGSRSRAEREAVGAEIVAALFSAALLAGLAFLALAAPALFGSGSDAWLRHAQWVGSTVFILRVLWALTMWRRRRRGPERVRPEA